MKQKASVKRKKEEMTAMAFGVFDGLHAGHRFFLRAASRVCGKLIAVVARDAAAQRLKYRKPHHTQHQRLRAVSQLPFVWRAVFGDHTQGTYTVLQRYKPDFICLGYDQKALQRDLRVKMRANAIARIPLVTLKSHHPRRYHTSLLAVQRSSSMVS